MESIYHPVFNPKPLRGASLILKSPLSSSDKLTALLELKLRQKDDLDVELIDAIYALCLNPETHETLRKEGALEAFKFYSDFALQHQTTVHKLQIETLVSELHAEADIESVRGKLVTLFNLED